MATLQHNFQALYDEVSRFLGTYGTSGPAGTDLTEAKSRVHTGYRRFLNAYEWTFKKTFTSLAIDSSEWRYQLPADFMSFAIKPTFSENSLYPPLAERNVQQILEMRAELVSSSYPEYWALRPGTYNKETGQRYELIFWPSPQASLTLYYQYRVIPEKLSAAADFPLGGAEAADALMECSLWAAEENSDDIAGIHAAAAARELAALIEIDKDREPKLLGPNLNGRHISQMELARGSYRVNNVAYNL